MTRFTTRRRTGARRPFGRLSWGAAGAVVGAALAAYVAAPCVAWQAEARDPAARAGAAARAAFADRLARRCEDLGAVAVRPAFSCAADTEAADLPAVPRACAGRAHRTLRLHVAGTPRGSDAPGATLGRVAAALAAAFPDDATLAPLRPASRVVGARGDAGVDGLRALGFRAVEVVRDGQVVGRFAVAAVAAVAHAGPAVGAIVHARSRGTTGASLTRGGQAHTCHTPTAPAR